MIKRYFKYILLVFIGAISMSSSCDDDNEPKYQYVKVVNQSGKDVYISLQYPCDRGNWPDYPEFIPTLGPYDLRYIPANGECEMRVLESAFSEKQDWYAMVVFAETVEKYTYEAVKYSVIYDELIPFSYRLPVYQRRINYRGNGKIDGAENRE